MQALNSACNLTFSPSSFHSGSERNVSKLTLDGVDVMGERLAEEVCLINLMLHKSQFTVSRLGSLSL